VSVPVQALADLDVLALDCQASGATPAHGDLLEIGWAICGREGLRAPIKQRFVIPRTERRVPAAVRELTGWSEACIAESVPEHAAWTELRQDMELVAARNGGWPVPAVIHYARFELPFLRDLHERLDGAGAFPLETVCLHAIAARLFPDLPRRNIRALAGYLGHSTELLRRCAGHVEASAFIWAALVPRLEQAGVRTMTELAVWLGQRAPARPRTKRVFPFGSEQRRALPDAPGVYRFLRSNGDVLYVGKATSLKKRVASHFTARTTIGKAKGPLATTERALELLTQVHDVAVTVTASILEAALLESDEIKRIEPPYNVQLRGRERNAWFASVNLSQAASAPDAEHRIGPLPSERALLGLRALVALAGGQSPDPGLQACALAVPVSFLPDDELFAEGFRSFAVAHLGARHPSARVRVDRGARALWLARGRAEPDAPAEDQAPDEWDCARVIRRLERTLTGGSLLVRRARWLLLLANADIAFREPAMSAACAFALAGGTIIERRELSSASELGVLPVRYVLSRIRRQASFDATVYDRMRVLATELQRVHEAGGELAIRFGSRMLSGARLAAILRWT
jgi:DNA polymerase-3 subunit epsilon